ncbi:phosphoenolpyruvate carboxykinase (ATP) [Hydrococcus rivularis]|uniref:phosphoenolpyruvate carboxykinase (ATP) n=1 Tax=Hydrococcus rivularis TaxID=1616834 RepID=UPI001C31CA11|nr:phosphoenolpyruvate carboxykinase (ATP) [Hydrococcus rivularis]
MYHPETYGLETLGIKNPGWVYRNIPVAQLIQHALARGEGRLASNGAFVVETGKYTGRSPQDRYIVDEPSTRDEIHWNNLNVPLYEETFDRLYRRVLAYVQGRDLYIFDDFVGADPRYRFGVRVVNEFAFQNLFVHQLFLRPTTDELAEHQADFTVIAVPGFQGDPEEDGIRSEGFVISGYTSKLAGTERGITTPQVTFSACFGQCFFSPRNRTGSTQ